MITVTTRGIPIIEYEEAYGRWEVRLMITDAIGVTDPILLAYADNEAEATAFSGLVILMLAGAHKLWPGSVDEGPAHPSK